MKHPDNQKRTPTRYLATFAALATALNTLLQTIQTALKLLHVLAR